MSEIFLKIMNMSISASYLVLAVLLLRLILKKAPKWVMVLLWGIVAVRLICPVSPESIFSLIPSAETISPEIMTDATPEIHTGIGALNSAINPVISESFAPDPASSANPLQIWIPIAGMIWLFGVLAMLVYTAVSYFLLRWKIRTAVRLEKHIFQSENVASPFVLGMIRPNIYLPFQMTEDDLAYVIAHEQAHIRRKDHLWKPLGFLLLAVHWFNPLMWLGYILLCRDIELACDEKVIKEMDSDTKANYTQALVSCSVTRRSIAACPLAFGEVGVKARVKSVLHYKKPAFWITLVSVVVCVAVAVCFLTNPTSINAKLSVFIDCQIAAHFQTEKSASNACCVNWEVLGTERSGAETTVYMWVLYDEYSMRNNELHQETASHIPTVITAKYDDGAYELVEYWEPRDGAYYEVDIRGKFPWYLQRNALDSQRYIKEQLAENKEIAKEYFGENRTLSLDDVITLSKKGYDLKWSDFEPFQYIETGSGLYIRVYQIDEMFEVWIGGTAMPDQNEDPMYIYLTLADGMDPKIDIRDGGVEEFIAEMKHHMHIQNGTNGLQEAISAAILEMNAGDRFPNVPTGAIHTHSYRILAMESKSGTPLMHQYNHMTETTVYIHYLYARYYYSGGQLQEQGSVCTPAAVRFSIDPEDGYTVKEFWEPDPGEGSDDEIREKFPREAAEAYMRENEIYFSNVMRIECHAQATEYLAQIGVGTEVYRPYIDKVNYDIDGDGLEEKVTLTYGPTSGVYSVTLYAEDTANALEYIDTYVLGNSYDLSFVADNGALRLKGENPQATPQTVYLDLSFVDGHIRLFCEDETVFWGSWES